MTSVAVADGGSSVRHANSRQKLLDALIQLPQSTREEQAALVTTLSEVPLDVLEESLLQVAHVCITLSNVEMQRDLQAFLLRLVSRSFSLAIRVSWIVDSTAGVLQLVGLGEHQQAIADSIETCAINRTGVAEAGLPVHGDISSPRVGDAATTVLSAEPAAQESRMAHEVTRKVLRLKAYTDVRRFVKLLTCMSDQLRLYPDRSKRKFELRRQLRDIDNSLPEMRLVYPLCGNSDFVHWIVRIPVEECTVFSSRERAPFLLRCEVIVDRTARMNDPTCSTMRAAGCSFRMSGTSDEAFIVTPEEHNSAPPPTSSGGGGASGSPKAAKTPSLLELAFGETSEARAARLRRESPYGRHPDWELRSVIVKAGDDIRQEELALQLIKVCNNIWKSAGLTCRVHPYTALSTCADAGIIECVDNANSIDGIKKACQVSSLHQFFIRAYGGESSPEYLAAQRNFIECMAGYSTLCYILQVKDRHNGNLMITQSGNLVHIDFGFLFVTSPGGLNFESAPFKLSQELLDTMGGVNSATFNYFKVLVYQGMVAIRDRADELFGLISLMTSYNTMPCFGSDPVGAVQQVRWRFRLDLETGAEFAVYVRDLILSSVDNWRTRRYDQFQSLQNGIL